MAIPAGTAEAGSGTDVETVQTPVIRLESFRSVVKTVDGWEISNLLADCVSATKPESKVIPCREWKKFGAGRNP